MQTKFYCLKDGCKRFFFANRSFKVNLDREAKCPICKSGLWVVNEKHPFSPKVSEV